MRLAQALPIVCALALLAAGPAVQDPAGAAIRGKATFDGKPPKDKKIAVDADPYCATQHAEGLISESFKIKDGKLQDVFVYVKNGLEGKTFPPSATPVLLDQAGCRYTPHVLGVQIGQPLLIRNSDPTMHNVHGLGKINGEFNFSQVRKGEEAQKVFNAPEIMIRVKCDVHGWMNSFVGVVAHPFFAVTGEDGSFELKGLPAGEYEIVAWHEKFGTRSQTVKVGEKETKEAADFVFKAKDK